MNLHNFSIIHFLFHLFIILHLFYMSKVVLFFFIIALLNPILQLCSVLIELHLCIVGWFHPDICISYICERFSQGKKYFHSWKYPIFIFTKPSIIDTNNVVYFHAMVRLIGMQRWTHWYVCDVQLWCHLCCFTAIIG